MKGLNLKHIILWAMRNETLKKLKPLRAFLRLCASGIADVLTLLKGFQLPSKWSWSSKLGFIFQFYEPGTTSLCKQLIKPGMTVIDIGANVGYFTIMFSKLVSSNGKVYAFEPNPQISEMLRYNVKNLENVIVQKKAVSNKRSVVEFFSSEHTTGSHGFFVPERFRTGSYKVEAVSLDDFVRDEGLSRIDLVKIDVEGAEPLVIEGMTDVINRAEKLFLVLEFNPSCLRLGHVDPEEFLEMLHKRFDAVYQINEEDGSVSLVPGTAFSNLVESIPEWKAVNLLCCKGEVGL